MVTLGAKLTKQKFDNLGNSGYVSCHQAYLICFRSFQKLIQTFFAW
jgi:hypothetical protein